MLKVIFNSTGGALHLEELKGSDGEIGLKVGESHYFGVINIGDISKFMKLCESLQLNVSSSDFNKSLFLNINEPGSDINILIGSRKFTEGWSSWRVSTMGLLNMGKSEGSQVIQLFGRGVRLKGKDISLKRSTYYGKTLEFKYLSAERLNIFGLKANYMEEFRKYLENEGVENGEMFDISLPVIQDEKFKKQNQKLKVLRLPNDLNYKSEKLDLEYVKKSVITNKVVINLYAKAQVIGLIAGSEYITTVNIHRFKNEELVFLNIDKLFLELIKYKNEKYYFNLNISKDAIRTFLADNDWYTLEAPENYFSIMKFADFERIQETYLILLKKYLDEFYKYYRNDWEKDYLEYQEMTDEDKNFIPEYNVSIEQTSENSDLIQKILGLQTELRANRLPPNLSLGFFKSFNSSKHLYNPVLFKNAQLTTLKITPIELNDGEIKFVEDLEYHFDKNPDEYANMEIFLLRNKSKVGIGFFEEGGFYPDFIMWILKDDKQYITFIDPKGIRNLNPITDPKLNFSASIKLKEQALGDPNIILNSFIISNTPSQQILDLHSNVTKIELENKNVLFQEDKYTYIQMMINKII